MNFHKKGENLRDRRIVCHYNEMRQPHVLLPRFFFVFVSFLFTQGGYLLLSPIPFSWRAIVMDIYITSLATATPKQKPDFSTK